MKDYRDMTLWELAQERQKIMAEVDRRHSLAKKAREYGHGDLADSILGWR